MDRSGPLFSPSQPLDFSRPRAFIFDLDGTLLDSTPWHAEAFRLALAEHAPELLPQFDDGLIKGRGSSSVFAALGVHDPDRVAALTGHKRRLYMGFIRDREIQPLPGAIDLLRFLRSRGRSLILVTSSGAATAHASLEAAGLLNLFDYTVTGDQAAYGKPWADLFQRALRTAQVPSWQAVTIEDAEIGVQASRLAGIEAILVNHPDPPEGILAFPSLEALYQRVHGDFLAAGLLEPTPPVRVQLTRDTEKVWDPRLGDAPPNYDPTSDRELFEVFRKAADQGDSVRLLRIGGPPLFRRQLLSLLDHTGMRSGPVFELLLDPRIPTVSVLLADPDGVAFLNRQDYEHAGSWGIWRVRVEVLRFAKALAILANLRAQGRLEVGLHRAELIWNLGIVGQGQVLVRAYGRGTGHDTSVQSRWLMAGDPTHMAESFMNFWDAVRRQVDTRWLTAELIDLNAPPGWPGLYKGNAVLSRERDFDKEDFSTDVTRHVSKICRSPAEHEAERRWLLIPDTQRAGLRHFRPVRWAPLRAGEVPPMLGREAMVMERVRGASLFHVASMVHELGQQPEHRAAACRVMGEILFDSLRALEEFRTLAGTVIPERDRRTYEYGEKLVLALTEVRGFIGPLSAREFNEALMDAQRLGDGLRESAREPFRDAHFKNRLWATGEQPGELARRLLGMDRDALRAEMSRALRDIDFETTGYQVTPWDDVLHLLFFEKTGVGPLCTNGDPLATWRRWWGPVDDPAGLWRTAAARATREFCRRLWYARTMPNSYVQRYREESREFFLDLALHALDRLGEFGHLRWLLGAVKDFAGLWGDAGVSSTRKPAVPALHPGDVEAPARSRATRKKGKGLLSRPTSLTRLPPGASRHRVFVSYCHSDARWRDLLHMHLRPLEFLGRLDFWTDTRISPGEGWREEIASALSQATAAVLLVSPGFMASEFIATEEVPELLAAEESRGLLILPVIISPSWFFDHPQLGRFQSVNPPEKPLADLKRVERDKVLAGLAKRLAERAPRQVRA